MIGSLYGQVVYAHTSKPLEFATIVVMYGAGPSPDIAPMTDIDGRFRLDELPAGDWALRAHGPNGEVGEATVRVSAGSAATIVIQVI